MDVRNCKGCGRLFNFLNGPPLCPACMKALDDKFAGVKEYIYNNPGSGIQIVSEEMEVSVQQIKNWIREERLSFSEESSIGIECESCGALIKTGRYCKECKDRMTHSLSNAYKNPPSEKKLQGVKMDSKDNPRMRFLSNLKDNKKE